MSRKEIEKLIMKGFPKNADVISFRDTEDTTVLDFHGLPKRVFSIAVDDMEYDELGEYGMSFEAYFPEVGELAQFIREAIAADRDIICQCEYGQGRSAGCAAAILQALYGTGISIFSDYRYYPNKLIYNKLIEKLVKSMKD